MEISELYHLDEKQVRQFYETISEVWPNGDMWHLYSKNQIERYIQKHNFQKNGFILNAGSGGNNYGIKGRMLHLDIAKNKIEHLSNATVASIESLPFNRGLFTEVICVGSVLNYCDSIAVINELSRILQANGVVIIEFESSWGLEYIKNSVFKKDAGVVSTKYCGRLHNQWLYSYRYISNIIKEAGFKIIDTYRFHIISGLHYSKYENENKAARLTKLDCILRYLPIINQYSNNIIVSCVKL